MTGPTADAATSVQQGNRAFERGDYVDAIRWYELAIIEECRLTPVLVPSIRRAESKLGSLGRSQSADGFRMPFAAESARSIKYLQGGAGRKEGRPTVLLVSHAAGKRLFGAERSLLDLAAAACEGAGCNVIVSLPSRNRDYIRALSAHACQIAVHEYGPWARSQPVDGGSVQQFERIIESMGVDLVHVNTFTLREPLIAARACGVPALVHGREIIEDDIHLQKLVGHDGRVIVSHINHLASRIVSNSQATQEAIDPERRGFVLPNTIDVDGFAREVQARGRQRFRRRRRLAVGLISSNVAKKGVEDFLWLAAECEGRDIDAQFIVIGPRNAYVKSLAGKPEYRQLSNVQFTGYIADPKDAMARIDVVCSFSHISESFGRTVLEAMAASSPAIVYDRGALPELVEDG
ncbi:MAG: glycosyltransferase family 4 protein, partial [Xanthomonadales bacterium]|nr:glycosyltransferase family 4 protein [Xanthomonadales bacterium]